jgi:hypothetical protein
MHPLSPLKAVPHASPIYAAVIASAKVFRSRANSTSHLFSSTPCRRPCYTSSGGTPPALAPWPAHRAWWPQSVCANGHREHGLRRPPSARGQAAAHRPTRPCGLPPAIGCRSWQAEPMGWNRPNTIHIFFFFLISFICLKISRKSSNFLKFT